jgi:hypothetical protein
MSPARRRVLSALLIVILAAALAPGPAIAKDMANAWEFGAYTLVSRYAGSAHMDNGVGWGVRGGYHRKATSEFEGSLDMLRSANVKISSIHYDVTKLSGDYLRNFLIKGHDKMIPFASLGLGIVKVDDGSDSTNSTAFRAGGGFKYFIKPRGGFRFDVKMYRWHGDGTVLPRDPLFSMDVSFAATFLVGGTP